MFSRLVIALGYAILCVTSASAHGILSLAPTQERIDYESLSYREYMAFDSQQRKRVFQDMTPKQRVTLMRAHIQNCRDVNLSKLNEAQLGMIDEALRDFVTQDLYTFPLTLEQERLREKWDKRIRSQFSGIQASQFFTMTRTCE